MFFHKYKRMDEDISIVHHKGIFKKELTLFQSVAMIVAGTIGAGVLGIPYAIAKVGSLVGLIYIIAIGFLAMALNLMIGEIAVRTNGDFQFAGLSRKYLGRFGQVIMTAVMYTATLGVLTVYIIGSGQSLSALFGGSSFAWSLGFFVVGAMAVYSGIKKIKVLDFVLGLGILLVISFISFLSFPHIRIINLNYTDLAYLLFPYGVLLFAFNGSTAVLETHSIMKNREKDFKKVIIIAGFILIVAYALFALTTLGVTGVDTTEIATIGLGQKIGGAIFILGNVFAVLAMFIGFLMRGLALQSSLTWDYHWPKASAVLITVGIPLFFFLLGLRKFILVLDLIGGIFISIEIFMTILLFWKSRQNGDKKNTKYSLHHAWLLVAMLLMALAVGAVYSVGKLF
ncbi:MAG TPA: hypothetical protein DEB09_04285 [Candidatus Magasanikbacteria bacterium]|nr:hypothetical protein [Candidatus Magasanikbacteria bacterium]